jgi:hypothetical protein
MIEQSLPNLLHSRRQSTPLQPHAPPCREPPQALAAAAEEEKGLLTSAEAASGDPHDPHAASAPPGAAVAGAAPHGGADPATLGGGGRAFAGGLKRVWSERRVAAEVVAR